LRCKLIDVTTDSYCCRLDSKYVDLYLIHGPSSGKNIDSFKAMMKLKDQGLIRYKDLKNNIDKSKISWIVLLFIAA